MQQRVAIARALAANSKLLLLDEPLAAVNPQTRADMQDLLLELAAKYKQTCLLVTHDVDEAVYVSDRAIVLSDRPTHVARNSSFRLTADVIRYQLDLIRFSSIYVREFFHGLSLSKARALTRSYKKSGYSSEGDGEWSDRTFY